MNNSTYYDYIFKVLILGDSAVGKTCFLLRYADDTFVDNHISTIGLDYRLKMINLPDSKMVKMQIWDTAGQDRFRAITKNYYKGAHGIILIYDVTSAITFSNIKNWLLQIKENTSEKIKIVLVANKIDDITNRVVEKVEGENLAKEYDINYFETSAKNNINLIETFAYLTKEILVLAEKNNGGTSLNNIKKKTSCCK